MKILIVEDEALSVMTMRDIFESWGYDVCTPAASAEMAFQCVQKECPDVILMDIHIIGAMDGIDAAEQIRTISDAVFIFMTGYSDEESNERALALKPFSYLYKPISFDELQTILATLSEKFA